MTTTNTTRRGARPTGQWIRSDLRLAIYLSDSFRCTYCGRDLHGADPQDTTLDHVHPWSLGGSNTPANGEGDLGGRLPRGDDLGIVRQMTRGGVTMKRYEVSNATSGVVLGIYEAEDEDGAIAAMLRDAGYARPEDCPCSDDGDVVAREVHGDPPIAHVEAAYIVAVMHHPFTGATWNHEMEPQPEGWGHHTDRGAKVCGGGHPRSCAVCRDAAASARSAKRHAQAAVKAARRGEWEAAQEAAFAAEREESRWGDSPTYRPFRDAVDRAAQIARLLARPCPACGTVEILPAERGDNGIARATCKCGADAGAQEVWDCADLDAEDRQAAAR